MILDAIVPTTPIDGDSNDILIGVVAMITIMIITIFVIKIRRMKRLGGRRWKKYYI